MIARRQKIPATPMSSITIRNLGPGIKERLRVRAAVRGHSMEAEARDILSDALAGRQGRTGAELVAAICNRFAPLGGVELELPPRGPAREAPSFE
jgi:antitoxin FitA